MRLGVLTSPAGARDSGYVGSLAYKGNDKDMAKLLWGRAADLNPHNEAVQANLEMFAGQ